MAYSRSRSHVPTGVAAPVRASPSTPASRRGGPRQRAPLRDYQLVARLLAPRKRLPRGERSGRLSSRPPATRAAHWATGRTPPATSPNSSLTSASNPSTTRKPPAPQLPLPPRSRVHRTPLQHETAPSGAACSKRPTSQATPRSTRRLAAAASRSTSELGSRSVAGRSRSCHADMAYLCERWGGDPASLCTVRPKSEDPRRRPRDRVVLAIRRRGHPTAAAAAVRQRPLGSRSRRRPRSRTCWTASG